LQESQQSHHQEHEYEADEYEVTHQLFSAIGPQSQSRSRLAPQY
jgi:hypothetical protein